MRGFVREQAEDFGKASDRHFLKRGNDNSATRLLALEQQVPLAVQARSKQRNLPLAGVEGGVSSLLEANSEAEGNVGRTKSDSHDGPFAAAGENTRLAGEWSGVKCADVTLASRGG